MLQFNIRLKLNSSISSGLNRKVIISSLCAGIVPCWGLIEKAPPALSWGVRLLSYDVNKLLEAYPGKTGFGFVKENL